MPRVKKKQIVYSFSHSSGFMHIHFMHIKEVITLLGVGIRTMDIYLGNKDKMSKRQRKISNTKNERESMVNRYIYK